MSEEESRRTDGWYVSGALEPSQARQWYGGAGAAPAPAAQDPDPDPERRAAELAQRQARTKRKRRAKVISISVSALILLGALTLGIWRFMEGLEIRVLPAAGSGRSGPPVSAGNDGPDDYRDFFSSVYTRSEDAQLPRADTGTGVTLTLEPQPARELSLREGYARVSPAVVGITTYIGGVRYGWGSGVVFTPDGYLITNTHILQSAEAVEATFPDGTVYSALLVGSDTASDIAVLKLEGDGAAFPFAVFGDSAQLRVGDPVAAIGNPLGENYAGTMTDGIISAISRDVVHNGYTMTLLQTNAAINEGNSGGPLINTYGQVVGITNMKIMATYTATVEGIAFAVPSAVVKRVADELIETGAVSGEPTIGITGVGVSPEARARYDLPAGVYVSAVEKNSDAQAQGLRVGDIILEVDGEPVTSVAQITAAKQGLAVGDTITLTVYRDGERFSLDIALVDKLDLALD